MGSFTEADVLLPRYGAWALECTGSLVAGYSLSCPTACGILVPLPRIEPASPALEGEFLTTEPSGKSLFQSFECFNLCIFPPWYAMYHFHTHIHTHSHLEIFGSESGIKGR